MRAERIVDLLYIGAHVLAFILGYLLGSYLVGKKLIADLGIDFSALLGAYIVLFFVHLFAIIGLDRMFPRLLTRVNGFFFVFLSHLVVIASFILFASLATWPDYLDKGLMSFLKDLAIVTLTLLSYFTLPFGLSLFIMNLVGEVIVYFFHSEEKAMAQGSLSEIFSASHEGGKSGKSTVLSFVDYAKQMVVGQDHAIETIQKVLIANSKLADLGNPKKQRILASFLFVGPTGVGKTETAKALANWLKDYGYDYLRIDANQFSDRESTWTLLGSPKGYIGSDKPGLLPYAISQNPKLVILIDEIEKADQGFYQFLLQMLDEGYVVERSTGNVYYLQRAIIIITSNLENKRIAEIMETLSDPVKIDIAVRKTLEGAVISFGGGRTFRITPEFLSRIDEVIPFRSLGFEDLVQIAYRELKGLGVNVSYETVYELSQKYYPVAKEYGVRYFLKKIQEDVLTQ